jgi:ER lumen protein retaining receptor
MNPFRFIGDMLHLAAILILLGKMLRHRSAAGISLKTQFLYAIVFTTRYLDLLTSFVSVYNTLMKVFFIATSYHICYLMRNKSPWKASYDRENDSFRVRYLIVPCAVLALVFHASALNEVMEVLWTFSEYLEAVAILPQIFLLEYTEKYDALTSHYLFALGAYRVFYVFNWIYRYAVFGHVKWVSVIAGVLQSLLFVDFFYKYVKQVVRRAKQKYDLAH